MADLNVFACTGRVGRDPETRFIGDGTQVTSFSVAIGNKKKGDDGSYGADWINVSCFRKTAEFAANYINKGDRIALSGYLQVRNWQDQEGNKRTATDIVANDLTMLTTKAEKEARGDGGGSAPAPQQQAGQRQRGSAGPGPGAPPPGIPVSNNDDYDPFGDEVD